MDWSKHPTVAKSIAFRLCMASIPGSQIRAMTMHSGAAIPDNRCSGSVGGFAREQVRSKKRVTANQSVVKSSVCHRADPDASLSNAIMLPTELTPRMSLRQSDVEAKLTLFARGRSIVSIFIRLTIWSKSGVP